MSYRFAAERTLGKLAKWLRLLGFDTIFEAQDSSDRFFKDLPSGRILLTRTQAIQEQYGTRNHIIIKSDHVQDQIRQVIYELGIVFQDIRPFSRCLSCNVEITEIEKDAIFGQVPDYVWDTHDIFYTCPECKRIYWPGSHTKHNMKLIEELFD
ncbi:MAG: Mut7-C RNAse domain-containing protein [Desulfobacterales bacterium]